MWRNTKVVESLTWDNMYNYDVSVSLVVHKATYRGISLIKLSWHSYDYIVVSEKVLVTNLISAASGFGIIPKNYYSFTGAVIDIPLERKQYYGKRLAWFEMGLDAIRLKAVKWSVLIPLNIIPEMVGSLKNVGS